MSSTRKRGRPLSFNREEALDSVLPLFRKKGYAATSLDELAAAAGLNRPNLGAAFGNKRGLYIASIERFRDRFAEVAGSALKNGSTLSDSLHGFFEQAAKIYSEDGSGCLLFSVTPSASSEHGDIRSELDESLKWLHAAIGERLERASSAEVKDPSRIPGLAIAISGILLTLAISARAGSTEADLRAIYQTALSAILNSIYTE